MSETRGLQLPAGPARALSGPLIAVLLGVAVIAFVLGPLVSPSHARAGEWEPKVVGGSVAADGSWPSQAFVVIDRSDGSYFCGGTLIRSRWVLTAAHCVTNGSGAVSAGSVETAIGINVLSDIRSTDWIGIRSVSVHPRFQEDPETGALLWDFALLELERASNQQTTALIAPGQESSTVGGQPGSIAGWGCTSQVPPGGSCPASPPLPADLIEAQVSFISDDECASPTSYGGGFDREIMVCAGNFETGLPDTCFGDSGGPLIAFGPGGERLLAGITSFGDGCAIPSFPGVYARVLAGRSWILETINSKGPTVSLKARPAKRAYKRKATFRFRTSESGSSFRCRLDGRSWRNCGSPRTYRNLKRGRKHTFRVKARKDGLTGPVRKYTWFVKRH